MVVVKMCQENGHYWSPVMTDSQRCKSSKTIMQTYPDLDQIIRGVNDLYVAIPCMIVLDPKIA